MDLVFSQERFYKCCWNTNRFEIYKYYMHNEQWIHMRSTHDISNSSVFLNLMKSIERIFIHTKIFHGDWIQRGYRKKINSSLCMKDFLHLPDLNLILFVAKLMVQLLKKYIHSWNLGGMLDLAWLYNNLFLNHFWQ